MKYYRFICPQAFCFSYQRGVFWREVARHRATDFGRNLDPLGPEAPGISTDRYRASKAEMIVGMASTARSVRCYRLIVAEARLLACCSSLLSLYLWPPGPPLLPDPYVHATISSARGAQLFRGRRSTLHGAARTWLYPSAPPPFALFGDGHLHNYALSAPMTLEECAEAGIRDRGCKEHILQRGGWVEERDPDNRFAISLRVAGEIWREIEAAGDMGKREKERRRALRNKVWISPWWRGENAE